MLSVLSLLAAVVYITPAALHTCFTQVSTLLPLQAGRKSKALWAAVQHDSQRDHIIQSGWLDLEAVPQALKVLHVDVDIDCWNEVKIAAARDVLRDAAERRERESAAKSAMLESHAAATASASASAAATAGRSHPRKARRTAAAHSTHAKREPGVTPSCQAPVFLIEPRPIWQ